MYILRIELDNIPIKALCIIWNIQLFLINFYAYVRHTHAYIWLWFKLILKYLLAR